MKLVLLAFYYSFAKAWPRQLGGDLLRSAICRRVFSGFGRGARVHAGVHFGLGSKLSLGSRSYLGRGSFLALDDAIRIGDDVMGGPEVMIFTANHGIALDRPMIEQLTTKAPVVIEDDVWLGARAILLPGVRIGSGAVVGAGSVVTRDVPPAAIVGGVPARVLRTRGGGDREA